MRKPAASGAVRHDQRQWTSGESWEIPRCGCTTWRRKLNCPARRIRVDEFRANLELALGKLPPRIAQVFQLYQSKAPNREVCEQLNISESNLG